MGRKKGKRSKDENQQPSAPQAEQQQPEQQPQQPLEQQHQLPQQQNPCFQQSHQEQHHEPPQQQKQQQQPPHQHMPHPQQLSCQQQHQPLQQQKPHRQQPHQKQHQPPQQQKPHHHQQQQPPLHQPLQQQKPHRQQPHQKQHQPPQQQKPHHQQQQQQPPPLHQPLQQQKPHRQQPHQKQHQTPQQQNQHKQQPQQQDIQKKTEKQEIEDKIYTKGAKDLSERNNALKIPQRKNREGGTAGRSTVVETNYFALDLNKAKQNLIMHYDVAIHPDRPKRLFRTVMETFRQTYYPKQFLAFDGKKNLYSCDFLPVGKNFVGSVIINDDERLEPKEYSIEIQHANTLNLKELAEYMRRGTSLDTPRKVMQAVDVILRGASVRNFIQVGRSFFSPEANLERGDLGDGLVLHSGFFQSASFGWKPFMNIDVAHRGFAKVQKVVDLMAEMANIHYSQLTTLSDWVKRNVEEYLKTLKVDYELPNQPGSKRCVRVNGLVGSSRNTTFKLDNGSPITILKYFEQQKRTPLQFPDLPCLHVGPPNRNTFVPAELCTVRSQLVMRPLTDRQASQMPRLAATSTSVRKGKILHALRQIGFRDSPTLQEFGFSVSGQFEKINARVLEAPNLEYGVGKCIKPECGKWRASHFVAGSQLKSWIVLNIAGSRSVPEKKLRDLADILLKAAQNVGMQVSTPLQPFTIDTNPENRVREMEKFFKRDLIKNLDLVIVVIPDKPDLYSYVKQVAELQVGVLTQCIKASTLNRSLNIATAANIVLKLNTKRNGTNHSLLSEGIPSCLKTTVMLVGADVTHPPPRVDSFPSVAAVCASHDPKTFCYNIQFRLQEPRKEIIVDLANIMVQHLHFFKVNRKILPEKIIFYRDGVGEGQFPEVLNYELRAIRAACQTVATNYEPKITFLVVQKRHHTRFFPLSMQDSEGKNNNVLPGTVVDTNITHPTETDFYMVSHASIQGVSRPTRYHKLWDDSDMSEDELECLTYYLCHMFSRCTRSVSYPAPTYYAHLAAFRIRAYIKGQRINVGNLAWEQKRIKIVDDICKKLPMFFV